MRKSLSFPKPLLKSSTPARRAITGGLRTVRKRLQAAYDRNVAGGARSWMNRYERCRGRTTSEKTGLSEHEETGLLHWTFTPSAAVSFRSGSVAEITGTFPEGAM